MTKTLIVGAGIAGLATARAFDLAGLPYRIVERSPAPASGGAGLYLPGNAARALLKLGLLGAVLVRSHPCMSQRIFDANGALLHDMDVASFWQRVGPCIALARSTLQDILASSITGKIDYGMACTGIGDDGDAVEVTFSDGSRDAFGLVVGADGLHSSIRGMTFGTGIVRQLPQRCWRMIVENAHGIDTWTVTLADRRSLLAVPLGEGRLYVYADAIDCLDLPTASNVGSWRHLFDDLRGPLRPVLDAIPPETKINGSRLCEVPVRSWCHRSTTLIGDAAHACSPSMAEGTALALEDALTLAACISRSARVDEALKAFSRKRLPRWQWVQKQCHARDGLRMRSATIRRTVLKLAGSALYRRSYGPLLRP